MPAARRYQGGTAGPEQIHAAAVGDNGSVAMIGYGGDWPHAVAAVVLDQDGDLLWEWQVTDEPSP